VLTALKDPPMGSSGPLNGGKKQKKKKAIDDKATGGVAGISKSLRAQGGGRKIVQTGIET